VGRYNTGELYNLAIRRGTLTAEEREKINDHIVVTIKMLEQLPFPKKMRRVPEYAGGHHEKMDGTGYPRGLRKSDMSIPARIMAIADIFEALTAADRPYKKAKTISESLKIMGFMCKDNHIDPDLFDLFLRSEVWQRYADEFLDPSQIDEVNIEDYLPNPALLTSKSAAE
jgi:HD-GYP domain-containing protein (c-di-GMP phosphodiesterase class II)